jgi:hypothetical protein
LEHHKVLVRKWWTDDNLSDERIATCLLETCGIQVSKSQVCVARRSMGLTVRGTAIVGVRRGAGPAKVLSEEQKELLKKWWEAGYTDSAIANRFWRETKIDFSEAFVRTTRIGFGFTRVPKASPAKKSDGAAPKTPAASPRAAVKSQDAPLVSEKMPAGLLVRYFALPKGRPSIPFSEVKDGRCRWPYDAADGSVVFCGAAAHVDRDGKTHIYCREHRGVGMRPLVSPLRPAPPAAAEAAPSQVRDAVS